MTWTFRTLFRILKQVLHCLSQCLQGLAVVCVSVGVPAYNLYGGEPGASRTCLAFTDRAARLSRSFEARL